VVKQKHEYRLQITHKKKSNKEHTQKLVRNVQAGPLIPLQLGVGLQERRQLLGEHDVAGDLQLALHEGSLGVQLAQGDVNHVLVGDRQGGVHLDALGGSLVGLGVLAVQS